MYLHLLNSTSTANLVNSIFLGVRLMCNQQISSIYFLSDDVIWQIRLSPRQHHEATLRHPHMAILTHMFENSCPAVF
jgi:hypothetical protein